METVKNTQKVTEAMKLVATAKVRRAQETVINSIPFAEAIVEVLFNINEQLQLDDIDVPLTNIRPVKKVSVWLCNLSLLISSMILSQASQFQNF